MFHVLIAEPIASEGVALLEAASDATCAHVSGANREALLEAVREADAIIIRGETVIDSALLDAAPRLKIVARAGAGLANVDVWAATERGMMVMNVPDVHAVAAAEYTLGLMLTLARHIPTADAALRRGEWPPDQLMGTELRGKTLGVIGLGHVGRKVAELGRAFDMLVIVYDPYVPEDVARELRLIMADLDELLSRSDFVSIHVPLTQETRCLIGPEEIARMKPGARLINISWGTVVDQDALCQALSGHLASAALDVFASEPPDARLRALSNVVLTPHLGDRTLEAQNEIATQIVQQVLDALRGTDFRNVVNMPFMADAGYDRLRIYLEAAEAMGILQVGLADGPIDHIQVECIGEGLLDQVRPITVALLKGVLESAVGDKVNYINAPLIAHERGIEVSQARGLIRPDYPALIACRVQGEGWERVMAGTVFGGVESRIVQIGRFHTDLKPVGTVLITRSVDVPGVIGQIGTLLGRHRINIAAMDYGRMKFGGDALSLLTVDSPASDEVVDDLLAIKEVKSVRQITF
jgi:D-3-phosphoglycerate dehydrogenase